MNKKSINSIFTSEFWAALAAEFRNLKSLALAGQPMVINDLCLKKKKGEDMISIFNQMKWGGRT